MRLSPACAGNARPSSWSAGSVPVQPRVCGERTWQRLRGNGGGGSAPHVRGTQPARLGDGAQHRFSPACAGNACANTATGMAVSVQPRVCGERAREYGALVGMDGSAPRVRGTHHPAVVERAKRRFSPACAGNATGKTQGRQDRPVQPRVCGERFLSMGANYGIDGSAPRVRGTRQGRRRRSADGRFSPACAGNALTP